MMEAEALVSIVTTVGFPIAVTVYLLYERTKETAGLLREVITENAGLREVIAENTSMTKELCVYIKGVGK